MVPFPTLYHTHLCAPIKALHYYLPACALPPPPRLPFLPSRLSLPLSSTSQRRLPPHLWPWRASLFMVGFFMLHGSKAVFGLDAFSRSNQPARRLLQTDGRTGQTRHGADDVYTHIKHYTYQCICPPLFSRRSRQRFGKGTTGRGGTVTVAGHGMLLGQCVCVAALPPALCSLPTLPLMYVFFLLSLFSLPFSKTSVSSLHTRLLLPLCLLHLHLLVFTTRLCYTCLYLQF